MTVKPDDWRYARGAFKLADLRAERDEARERCSFTARAHIALADLSDEEQDEAIKGTLRLFIRGWVLEGNWQAEEVMRLTAEIEELKRQQYVDESHKLVETSERSHNRKGTDDV